MPQHVRNAVGVEITDAGNLPHAGRCRAKPLITVRPVVLQQPCTRFSGRLIVPQYVRDAVSVEISPRVGVGGRRGDQSLQAVHFADVRAGVVRAEIISVVGGIPRDRVVVQHIGRRMAVGCVLAVVGIGDPNALIVVRVRRRKSRVVVEAPAGDGMSDRSEDAQADAVTGAAILVDVDHRIGLRRCALAPRVDVVGRDRIGIEIASRHVHLRPSRPTFGRIRAVEPPVPGEAWQVAFVGPMVLVVLEHLVGVDHPGDQSPAGPFQHVRGGACPA